MDVHGGYGASPFPHVRKTRQGPLPVPHPRRRLTAVTDDEQLEEVIVVPGHAGSWWLTPALCRVFARFAVRPPRLANKIPAAGSQERKPTVALLGTVSPPSRRRFSRGFAASAILSLRCKQPETPLPSLLELHLTLTPASVRMLQPWHKRPVSLKNIKVAPSGHSSKGNIKDGRQFPVGNIRWSFKRPT